MNSLRTVKVNERGQIVIPEEIRKHLKIKPNSILVLMEDNDGIVIRKEDEILGKLDEEDRDWLMAGLESLFDMDKEEEKHWRDMYEKYERMGWNEPV